jgi:hypothetical protein
MTFPSRELSVQMQQRFTTESMMEAEIRRIRGTPNALSAVACELQRLAAGASDAMPRKAVSRAKLSRTGVRCEVDGLALKVRWEAGTVYLKMARKDCKVTLRIVPFETNRIGTVYEVDAPSADAAKDLVSDVTSRFRTLTERLRPA